MVGSNMEQSNKVGSKGPSLDVKLGTRIKEMVESIGYNTAAAISGKSSRSIARYVNGHEASFPALVKIAEKAKVSLHWLATGEGAMFIENEQHDQSKNMQSIQMDGLQNVIEVTEEYFVNNNLDPSPKDKARIFVAIYNILIDQYKNETFDREFLENHPNVIVMAAVGS